METTYINAPQILQRKHRFKDTNLWTNAPIFWFWESYHFQYIHKNNTNADYNIHKTPGTHSNSRSLPILLVPAIHSILDTQYILKTRQFAPSKPCSTLYLACLCYRVYLHSIPGAHIGKIDCFLNFYYKPLMWKKAQYFRDCKSKWANFLVLFLAPVKYRWNYW